MSHIGVDKMLNAFTMHSFFITMPSKIAVTMPFGTGAFRVLYAYFRPAGCPPPRGGARQGGGVTQKTNLIHLIINQFNSL